MKTREMELGSSHVYMAEGSYAELSVLNEYFTRVGLSDEIAHLWCMNITETHAEALINILSENEKQKAGSYKFEIDRSKYVFCRGVLRLILGMYLRCEPQNIEILYDENGKPYLKESNGSISFNMSHSNDVVVYAFTASKRIGIDVEYIRSLRYLDDMAERLFDETGLKEFRQLSAEQKNLVYISYWTMKEACFKTTGHDPGKITYGYTDDPNKNDVSLNHPSLDIISFLLREDYISSVCISKE
jgi:4'-phosphopantetheinyl transferase